MKKEIESGCSSIELTIGSGSTRGKTRLLATFAFLFGWAFFLWTRRLGIIIILFARFRCPPKKYVRRICQHGGGHTTTAWWGGAGYRQEDDQGDRNITRSQLRTTTTTSAGVGRTRRSPRSWREGRPRRKHEHRWAFFVCCSVLTLLGFRYDMQMWMVTVPCFVSIILLWSVGDVLFWYFIHRFWIPQLILLRVII